MDMKTCDSMCGKYAEYSDVPLRLVLALVFLTTGSGKLFGGIAGVTQMLAGIGFPVPVFWAWLLAIVEFFGAIALLLGLYTRIVSGFMVIILVVAILTVKLAGGWGMGLFVDMTLLGAALSLVLSGATSWSLDGMMCRKK